MLRLSVYLFSALLIAAPASAEPPSKPDAVAAKRDALSTWRATKGDITCGQIGAIACGQTVTGSLNLTADCMLTDGTVVDQYSFMAQAGQRIIADLVSDDFDSFLFLTDTELAILATDDDSGGGLNSRIDFTFGTTEEVFLLPNSFTPAEGDYSLTVTCPGGGGGGGGHPVTGAISGSWYDPTHDGEGWKIEIVNETTAVVYWFTYPPPGSTTKQAWVVGVGRIEGDKIIIDEGLIPSGATFGPDFDPADVNRAPWGSFTFTFSGPNAGRMDYQGPAGFGSGSFNIVRLTSIAQKGVAPDNVGPGISGSWYDPTHDGEGWIIEVIDATTAVIYWFTYDEAGNQAWNIGIGELKGNQIVVEDPVETEGTFFGPTFDPNDVVRTKWGTYVFAFNEDCNTGVMSYGSAKGLGFNQFDIVRLTSLQGVPCTGFDPTQSAINTLATNVADALLLNSMRMDGHETDFFGQKSAGGAPESLTGMKIKDPVGKEGDVLTDDQGMPAQITDEEEGDTVGIEQTGEPGTAVFSGLTKDGSLQSLVSIALDDLGQGAKRSADKTVRDAPRRAGKGSGWVSPIPALKGTYQKGANESLVTITQCDVPLDGAVVEARVSSADGSVTLARELRGISVGQGQYRIRIPNDASGTVNSPATACGQFVNTTGDSCAFVDQIDDVDVPEICLLIASAMVENSVDPTDLVAAANFLESCAFGLYATKLSCRSAGGAIGQGQSRQNFVCNNVGQQNNSINRLLPAGTSNILLELNVNLPGRGRLQLDPQVSQASAPINGPYPDFDIDLQEDPTIASFFTVPVDPEPFEDYTATARITCAGSNTPVTMSIVGTDGFIDEVQCAITGSGDCNLRVPGAEAGVRDTITVVVEGGPRRQIQIIF